MNLAADMGHHSGRATPSLHDAPYRQFEEATGRRSTYPLPIPVQTNPATSLTRFAGRLSLRGFNDRVWPELARKHGRDGAGAKKKS